MLKKIFASLALSLATATAAFAETKVGFIYVGPIGDLGWTYRHDVGRLAVEEAYGPDVSTSYLEMVPEGPEAVQAITQLAETGHDIIFTTSFGYMDATNEVAANYPDVAFEHATVTSVKPITWQPSLHASMKAVWYRVSLPLT